MAFKTIPPVCRDCIHKYKGIKESPCSDCGAGNLLKETVDEEYHPGCTNNDIEGVR